MNEFPNAREVTLKKLKPLAPFFHRHIARSRLIGRCCTVGDRVVVYEVLNIQPHGMAVVTDQTLFRFVDE